MSLIFLRRSRVLNVVVIFKNLFKISKFHLRFIFDYNLLKKLYLKEIEAVLKKYEFAFFVKNVIRFQFQFCSSELPLSIVCATHFQISPSQLFFLTF